MNSVRVKICGLTRSQDVKAAVLAGADALGFVFVPASPRYIEAEVAAQLCLQVPAFVSRVGLFLDQEAIYVRQVLSEVPLNLLQFHGGEDAAFCRQFGLPYLKAVNLDSKNAVKMAEKDFNDAAGLVLDSHKKGGLGGTGKPLDWSQISASGLPLILAGGLNPSNVATAVKNAKAGQVRYRTDKAGIIHCPIGRADFEVPALRENLEALLADLRKARPASAKGSYIKKLTVSSTMGLGVSVDRGSIDA